MNQTQDVYNGLGQLTGEYQSVSGAVDTGSTPEVQYGYSSIATGSNMISMTYPNGRVLDYGYDGNALDEAIGRIDSLSDGGGSGASADLVEYQYQGLSTIISQTENGSGDSSISISTTLNQFGQIAETQASSVNGGTLQDFQYGYDADGNVLYKNNDVDSSLSELYTYDSLNRLTSFARGTLNDGDNAIATASALAGSTQSWDLDALGNQISTTTDGTAVDKSQNSQNELTGVGSSDLSYDNDGNTLIDNQGHHLVYNAWNELVTVKNSADTTTLASYTYDPAGDRITETHGGTTTDVYFSNQGQVLEERQGGVVTNQYVWNIDYQNDLLLRDDNSVSGNLGASGSGLGVRLYALHDANYNVTVLVNTSGDAVQDFVYSAYGVQTVINPSTGGATTDAYSWIYGFQGGRYDAVTGLIKFGERNYCPATGTWMEQDPAGYIDGTDLYGALDSSPITRVDPVGLAGLRPEQQQDYDDLKAEANSWSSDGWVLASDLLMHFLGNSGLPYRLTAADIADLNGNTSFTTYILRNIAARNSKLRKGSGGPVHVHGTIQATFNWPLFQELFYTFHTVRITYDGTVSSSVQCEGDSDNLQMQYDLNISLWKVWNFSPDSHSEYDYLFDLFREGWELEGHGDAHAFHLDSTQVWKLSGSQELHNAADVD